MHVLTLDKRDSWEFKNPPSTLIKLMPIAAELMIGTAAGITALYSSSLSANKWKTKVKCQEFICILGVYSYEQWRVGVFFPLCERLKFSENHPYSCRLCARQPACRENVICLLAKIKRGYPTLGEIATISVGMRHMLPIVVLEGIAYARAVLYCFPGFPPCTEGA
jgi:hypothetical protein